MFGRWIANSGFRCYSVARTAKIDPSLKASEVIVKVDAHTVRYSHYNRHLSDFGTELVGTVEKVGEDSDFNVGDRIFAGISTNVNFTKPLKLHTFNHKIMEVPESIKTEDALASVGNYALGYLGLKKLALEKQGNSILLLGQNRSLSSAILDLAQNLFECQVTGVSDSKLNMERFQSQGCNEVLNWKDETLIPKVLERTFGVGADFVIDTVGGDALEKLQHCIKPNGLLLILDQSSGRIPVINTKTLIERNLTVSSISFEKQNPADVRKAFQMAMQILESGMPRGVAPIVVTKDDEARNALEDNRFTGQVVMRIKH
ncbi:unnamed protein product [Bursaphelenchus okinawaensis]|uniref:Enoyl reductase (ER) domain-containing protein n=1 Tax=Bursaphelenchus okinawaensis TaxID=465554 RepID=A0A811KVP4_9BILA|nr:unnamed protein product [Bursaphelenchus okinawaensis]CAG9112168.1 unnamed protein product [Bursaphelenchus okinawaensis]